MYFYSWQGQKQSQEKFYTMASQIKLLLEIPERVWSAMESSQYLQATQLYLLCCHLHSQLHLEGGGHQYSPVLSRFPILVRQVAAAGHFRYTVLHYRLSKCILNASFRLVYCSYLKLAAFYV